MSHFVNFHSALMYQRVHKPIFCSALQSKTWYELLVRELELIVIHKEVLESEGPSSRTRTVLKVYRKPCIKCWRR